MPKTNPKKKSKASIVVILQIHEKKIGEPIQPRTGTPPPPKIQWYQTKLFFKIRDAFAGSLVTALVSGNIFGINFHQIRDWIQTVKPFLLDFFK